MDKGRIRLPQASFVGLGSRLEDDQSLDQSLCFFSLLSFPSILSELQQTFGDGKLRKCLAILLDDDAILALRSGGKAVEDLETDDLADKALTQDLA